MSSGPYGPIFSSAACCSTQAVTMMDLERGIAAFPYISKECLIDLKVVCHRAPLEK